MAATDDAFEQRKTTVQDILSSFDRETLPSEFRMDLIGSVDKEQGQRPSSEWTIPGDLMGSLLQWGIQDTHCYDFLERLQPSSTRSRLFHEKVVRRLAREFEKYKEVESDRSGSAADIRQEVRQIANNMRAIVEASWDRQLKENKAVPPGVFVKALADVCENHLDLAGGGMRTRRTSASQPEASLFHMLVVDVEPDQDHFMLDLFDRVAHKFTELLLPHKDTLEYIAGRLAALNAPQGYRTAFQRIIDVVNGSSNEEEDTVTGPSPPPPPPPPGSGEGPSGTKRRAPDTPGRKAGRRKMGV